MDASILPLSNDLTRAADELSTPSVVIRSDGTPVGTTVKMTTGQSLGLVQSISWNVTVGQIASCVITSVATPAEVKALARDTTVLVRPAAGYHPFRYLWDWYVAKASSWIAALHKAPTP